MNAIHMTVGIGVIALNLIAGVWGGVAWLRKDPSVIFWYLLRAAQLVLVVQVALGVILLASGRQAADQIHLLYGILPLAVTLISEAMRAGAAQHELEGVGDLDALEERQQAVIARRVVLREMGIMAVGAILIVTIALRAYAVGSG